jgi:YbgC/YbaW family acyl-CoA thioester hydrolase
MESLRLVSEMRVRSCDVDSFGHVNNAVYLQYCEGARNDYMLQRGLAFADFQKWNAAPVLIAASLEYKQPARTDDELRIFGKIELEGRARFSIRHEMLHAGTETLICQANLEFVFVRLDSGKPCRIPEKFLRAFELQ